jgi:uncharacterized DUF497 family protein
MNDIDPTTCRGFQWDEGNAEKNWRKHRVSKIECEQVFFSHPLVVRHDPEHSDEDEVRFYALGHTDSTRLLFIVFTVRDHLIRVISARDMSKRERRIYIDAEN